MNQALCITGMHRSGTSLTTSWLEQCGVNIHNGQLFGSSIGNVKGLFEDKEFVNLHNESIEQVSEKSKGWQIFCDEFLVFDNGHLRTATKLIKERNQKYSIWGWKDPRTVFFLPQWKHLIPNLKVILVWREFEQVVSSLLKRSAQSNADVFKISFLKSISLWVAYNRRVLAYKNQFPQDSLLLPLKYIINNDKSASDCIKQHLKIDLEYKPISTVYEEPKLNKKPNVFLQYIAYFYGVPSLTASLRTHSDICSSHQLFENISLKKS